MSYFYQSIYVFIKINVQSCCEKPQHLTQCALNFESKFGEIIKRFVSFSPAALAVKSFTGLGTFEMDKDLI